MLCSSRVSAISVRHGGGGEFHVPQADCADVYHRRRAEYRARRAGHCPHCGQQSAVHRDQTRLTSNLDRAHQLGHRRGGGEGGTSPAYQRSSHPPFIPRVTPPRESWLAASAERVAVASTSRLAWVAAAPTRPYSRAADVTLTARARPLAGRGPPAWLRQVVVEIRPWACVLCGARTSDGVTKGHNEIGQSKSRLCASKSLIRWSFRCDAHAQCSGTTGWP